MDGEPEVLLYFVCTVSVLFDALLEFIIFTQALLWFLEPFTSPSNNNLAILVATRLVV